MGPVEEKKSQTEKKKKKKKVCGCHHHSRPGWYSPLLYTHFFCCLVAACICWAVCSVFLTALLLATVSTTTGTDTLLGLARSFHLEASFFPFSLFAAWGERRTPQAAATPSILERERVSTSRVFQQSGRVFLSLSAVNPPKSICGEKKKRVAFVSQLSQ